MYYNNECCRQNCCCEKRPIKVEPKKVETCKHDWREDYCKCYCKCLTQRPCKFDSQREEEEE